ncbi:MAG: carboxylesterase/lipase family protein [Thermoanaerobaculia bacterium]|nr:carboxylesterase/lipase family protein [Thermoanaerobaculia bacterium]
MGVVVRTSAGPVSGREEDGLAVFRGIPYAEPPVAELRFRPPVPPSPWAEPRDCGRYGPYAPQVVGEVQRDVWALSGEASEDCLSLNIWTPGADDGRRPVMVWIHGGAFVVGASSRGVTEGAALAAHGDVVVSLNYRLGALGWLQLDGVGGDEYAGSGNLGLQDQILALRWVRENIAAFGGDPDNVTLFGESAGSISVAVLMTTPAARGLFHKAICQSGGASIVRRTERAREITTALMEIAGAPDLAALRALPADDLVAAQAQIRPRGAEQVFGPTIDDVVVPDNPMDRIRAGTAADVPLIIGSNLDEYRYWYQTDPRLPTLGTRHLERRLREVTGRDPARVVAAYEGSRPELDDNQIAVTLIGDIAFRLPALRMAEAREAHGGHTWMYLFTRQSPVDGGRLGAAHAMDIPFVFRNVDVPNVPRLIGDTPDRAPLAEAMSEAWLAFARNGSPTHAAIPGWGLWTSDERTTMIFDDPCTVAHDPLCEERLAWGDAPFTLHA